MIFLYSIFLPIDALKRFIFMPHTHISPLKAILPAMVIFTNLVALAAPGEPTSDPAALKEIGTWDGVTESADLSRPYEDRLQQEIGFGQRSYYLAPWRAYMDTWPAARFLRMPGIYFNVSAEQSDATAAVLAECGFRTARIEIGWDHLTYDDPTRFVDEASLRTQLTSLKKHGIRPLILLNSNGKGPCPLRTSSTRLLKDAEVGATTLELQSVRSIRPHYTGLMEQNYAVASPMIVQIDEAANAVKLSAPLKKAIAAGPIRLTTLRYRPFGGRTLADGTPNPAAQETVDGWDSYMKVVIKLVHDVMGTKDDAGFDLEIWNEYSFGSQFLDDKNYYSPPIKYSEPIRYAAHGMQRTGPEILLPMAVDYVSDPKNRLPGVRVISGFANQRPRDSGSDLWPSQKGFSRHYYTSLRPFGNFNNTDGLVSPETDRMLQPVVNALGQIDGQRQPDKQASLVPGSFFIPTLAVSMPEVWHYGYKTEFLTRDVQPFPGPMPGHGRYTHPGNGRAAEVWQSEYNTWRWPWVESLIKNHAVDKDDPALATLMHRLGAKALLRGLVFHSHKGLETITAYTAQHNNNSFAVIPAAFFDALAKNNFQLNDAVRAQAGPQLAAIKRACDLMREGEAFGDRPTRALRVEKLVEHKPRLVFRGDGTPAHPDVYHRDDFAVLPWQLADNRFAVGFYVLTRNIVHEWDPAKPLLDAARYDMPDQQFDLTLGNVRGLEAVVRVLDPMTDLLAEAKIMSATATSLTVRVATTDYPRFLLIDEAQAGPTIDTPMLEFNDRGTVTLRVRFAVPVGGELTWGRFPQRSGQGSIKIPAVTKGDQTFDIGVLPVGSGARLSVEASGLTAIWPRWPEDTAGVRWGGIDPTRNVAADWKLRLPALPTPARTAGYQLKPQARGTWKAAGPDAHTAAEADVIFELTHVRDRDRDVANVEDLMPDVSALDSVQINAAEWGDRVGWQIEARLEPTAHPSEPHLFRLLLAVQSEKGAVVLVAKSKDKLTPEQIEIFNKRSKSVLLTP